MANPPAHVMQMRPIGAEQDDDDPTQQPDGADTPGGPMPLPATPLPPAVAGGPGTGQSMPTPGGNPQVNQLTMMIVQNLTPQEIAELDSMITPRLAQLASKAIPALTPVLQAFAAADAQPDPTAADPQDGSGGDPDADNDSDALAMGGAQAQYQPNYGAPPLWMPPAGAANVQPAVQPQPQQMPMPTAANAPGGPQQQVPQPPQPPMIRRPVSPLAAARR